VIFDFFCLFEHGEMGRVLVKFKTKHYHLMN